MQNVLQLYSHILKLIVVLVFEFLSVSGYVGVILTPISNKGVTTHITLLPFAGFSRTQPCLKS